jgi:hypothetical protein
MRGLILPFMFIGDAIYPMWPWYYSPFKEEKNSLLRRKVHWNFIQSNNRMAVDKEFGILKGRWWILLRRINMSLRNVPNIITATFCLDTLCII